MEDVEELTNEECIGGIGRSGHLFEPGLENRLNVKNIPPKFQRNIFKGMRLGIVLQEDNFSFTMFSVWPYFA